MPGHTEDLNKALAPSLLSCTNSTPALEGRCGVRDLGDTVLGATVLEGKDQGKPKGPEKGTMQTLCRDSAHILLQWQLPQALMECTAYTPHLFTPACTWRLCIAGMAHSCRHGTHVLLQPHLQLHTACTAHVHTPLPLDLHLWQRSRTLYLQSMSLSALCGE